TSATGFCVCFEISVAASDSARTLPSASKASDAASHLQARRTDRPPLTGAKRARSENLLYVSMLIEHRNTWLIRARGLRVPSSTVPGPNLTPGLIRSLARASVVALRGLA